MTLGQYLRRPSSIFLIRALSSSLKEVPLLVVLVPAVHEVQEDGCR